MPSLSCGRSLLFVGLGRYWTRLESLGERDLALLLSPVGGAASMGWASSGGLPPLVSCLLEGAWTWLSPQPSPLVWSALLTWVSALLSAFAGMVVPLTSLGSVPFLDGSSHSSSLGGAWNIASTPEVDCSWSTSDSWNQSSPPSGSSKLCFCGFLP